MAVMPLRSGLLTRLVLLARRVFLERLALLAIEYRGDRYDGIGDRVGDDVDVDGGAGLRAGGLQVPVRGGSGGAGVVLDPEKHGGRREVVGSRGLHAGLVKGEGGVSGESAV